MSWYQQYNDKGFQPKATVVLNANVAFLAIQSVDTDSPSRRPEQIASYISVIASIGSIIIGLLLIKMSKTRLQDTAPYAVSNTLPFLLALQLMLSAWAPLASIFIWT